MHVLLATRGNGRVLEEVALTTECSTDVYSNLAVTHSLILDTP
jgi:hypothetical protein